MIEALIEKTGVEYAEKLGWKVRKATTPGKTGTHDRIHHKNGVTFYIEYKSTGKSASPKQLKFAQEMRDAGIPSRCIESVTTARAFIDIMDGLANQGHIDPSMKYLSLDISSFYPA